MEGIDLTALSGSLGGLINFAVLALAGGAAVFYSTDFVKLVVNLLLSLFGDVKLSGQGSWVVALALSVGAVFGLDVDYLAALSIFEGVDPGFVNVIGTALLGLGANTWHDKVFDPQ